MLTTPIVRALKRKHENSEIDFLVKKEFSDVYKFNPYLNEVIEFNKNDFSEIKKKLNKYNLIIDLQNNLNSKRLTFNHKSTVYKFRKPTLKKLILVNFKVDLLKKENTIVERYANAAKLNLDDFGLDIFYNGKKIEREPNERKIIGICPGAKHRTKRWLTEYFIDIGNKLVELGYEIAIFGGTSEKELCDEINKGIKNSTNYQNNNELFETALNMKSCSLIITNDSGLMHLAAAINIPIVAIFGSTVKSFGFVPYKVKNLIIENNSIDCRPCSHIGKNDCPKRHFKCMRDITPESVLSQIKIFLKEL
ncbi:MAG: glycosyltransferase family 9 protein [Melioribacteraceae bacterium]|nr:glycosyltransferase family 9 protein [Melioribacteraceae bacterium]